LAGKPAFEPANPKPSDATQAGRRGEALARAEAPAGAKLKAAELAVFDLAWKRGQEIATSNMIEK